MLSNSSHYNLPPCEFCLL